MYSNFRYKIVLTFDVVLTIEHCNSFLLSHVLFGDGFFLFWSGY